MFARLLLDRIRTEVHQDPPVSFREKPGKVSRKITTEGIFCRLELIRCKVTAETQQGGKQIRRASGVGACFVSGLLTSQQLHQFKPAAGKATKAELIGAPQRYSNHQQQDVAPREKLEQSKRTGSTIWDIYQRRPEDMLKKRTPFESPRTERVYVKVPLHLQQVQLTLTPREEPERPKDWRTQKTVLQINTGG